MVLSSSCLAVALLALPFADARSIGTTVSKPQLSRDNVVVARSIAPASNVVSLKRTTSTRSQNPRSAAHLLQKKRAVSTTSINPSNKTSPLISLNEGNEFATTIQVGSQSFDVIVDTGSSDTWLAEKTFTCISIENGTQVSQAECGFGPLYEMTNTFSQIANENLNITYGDGESVVGVEGIENVTVAGLSVNQQIGLVNYAVWQGDGSTTGLMGLAYPAITSAFSGTDPAVDGTTAGKPVTYSPIISTLINSSSIAPLFSLAIDRNVNGSSGYLALGGTPPVNFTNEFTSTPILVTSIDGYDQGYDFYTINIDSLVVDGFSIPEAGGKDVQYIIDSGTTLAYLPTPFAFDINSAFEPPAFYDEYEGAFIVDCQARAPDFGITINGTTFTINPLDLILFAGEDEEGNDVCLSGITIGGDSKDDLFILGDTFQHNVVTVFDIGATELRFAARENYPSNDPFKA